MDVAIVEDQGTHLLISRNGRFAIIERRNDRLYNCHGGKREGIPLGRLSDIETILDHHDWIDEAAAREQFSAIVDRGQHLSQTML